MLESWKIPMKALSTVMAGQKEGQFFDPAKYHRCGPGSIPVLPMQNFLLSKVALRVDFLRERPFPLPVEFHQFCILINLSVTCCRII